LRQIGEFISQEELETARETLAGLPDPSTTFDAIAMNPDYDQLIIEPRIVREKLRYTVLAGSSHTVNLNDPIGHVLSEGDLSAAGMALLLALASGDTHGLGFLVLDDPAQGMDRDLQERFASILANREEPAQLLVLTHQRTFADFLEQAGAIRKDWQLWTEVGDA
jgi:energy-coupling factor transporter ATP-binding protein EcfA2